MPKRLVLSVLILSAALSGVLGVTRGVVRATQNDYACLQFYYNARQNWVLDLNSGTYLHDKRITSSPLDIRRGAVSPDGAYVAYVTQTRVGFLNLYVQPNDAPTLNMPTLCTDVMTCWRSQAPSAAARQLQLDTPAAAIGWSPSGEMLGYLWGARIGAIKVAVSTPEGRLIAERSVEGDHFMLHGWSASGRHLIFSTQERLDESSRLSLHFWAPQQNVLRSYPLEDVRNVSWYSLTSIAPQAERIAIVATGRDNMPTLFIVSAQNGIERHETLPLHIDWRANWSPKGDSLGLYHFDPPYWHFSLYEVAGATHRSIGGVTTGSSLAKRDGLREFYWAVDGESAAFLRPNRDETSALVRYRLADRQIVPMREAVLSAYESPAKGRVALVRREGDQMALEVLDVQSGSVRSIAVRPHIGDVLWLRGADALVFTSDSPEDGLLYVEHADLSQNAVQTLFRAQTLYDSLNQETATNLLTVWWRSEAGQTYFDAYTPAGRRAYRYRLLSGRSSRPPILFSTADRRAALIMVSDENGADYLQLASGNGERALLIDNQRHSTTALWSPDGEHVAIVTSPLGNAPSKGRQRLRVLDQSGALHYDFQAITVGLLHAWTRCG
jgi:hypothetical protein